MLCQATNLAETARRSVSVQVWLLHAENEELHDSAELHSTCSSVHHMVCCDKNGVAIVLLQKIVVDELQRSA